MDGPSKQSSSREEFTFEREGRPGRVIASVGPSPEPSSEGFPTCSAVIDYDADGYDAFFGWVQLVKSTDNSSKGTEFEMDPFFLFQDSPSPYCFFGQRPTLFDAPSRQKRDSMKWLAHSFLAYTPVEPDLFADLRNRRVSWLLGFSWGFEVDARGRMAILPIERLGAAEWNRHLQFFRTQYPTWRFDDASLPEGR